jgi:hypothetical protein
VKGFHKPIYVDRIPTIKRGLDLVRKNPGFFSVEICPEKLRFLLNAVDRLTSVAILETHLGDIRFLMLGLISGFACSNMGQP